MSSEILSDLTEAQPEGRLPWHKPEIQRITVSLETAGIAGSNTDGFGGATIIPSDLRLKQDVSDISNALAGVLALHGVTYRYNTSKHPALDLSDQPQIGFLAQDLEQVYPQVVVTRKDGFKAVNYALLVPVLAEAIKEQQAMIADLQAQVARLQAESVKPAV